MSAASVAMALSSGVDRTNDLRLLPNAANLWMWYDLSTGVTLKSAMRQIGPTKGTPGTSPACTLSEVISGAFAQNLSLTTRYESTADRSTNTFRWSTDDGGTWQQTGLSMASGVVPAAGTGLAFNFATGTYTKNDKHRACIGSLDAVFGGTNFRLLDSQNTLTVYEAWGVNNKLPSAWFNTSILTNQLSCATPFSGTNVPFDIWDLQRLENYSVGPEVMVPWAFQSTVDAGKNIIDHTILGPSLANGRFWGCNRSDNSAVLKQAFALLSIQDTTARPKRFKFDGTNLSIYFNGMLAMSAPASFTGAATIVNRFTMGGVMFGPSAASNFARTHTAKFAAYTAVASDSDAEKIWQAFS